MRGFLQQNNIEIMSWYALSLNLNLIEHPWDETQRQLNKVQPELNLVHNSGGFGLIFLWH
jgi:hypothetical protein